MRQVEAVSEEVVQPSARGGDRRRMRGVPIRGPVIGGTSIGTDPVRALLVKRSAGASASVEQRPSVLCPIG